MKSVGYSISRAKNLTVSVPHKIMHFIVAFPITRALLNSIYLKLNPSQRSRFYQGFAKIFRHGSTYSSNGTWKSVFRGKNILMPLRSEQFWLDWDLAVSIVGHDIEVKETYDALFNSSESPELFIDIGANYGTHSLLFLTQNVKTITFEPNRSCHDYFKNACQLNGVTPHLEQVALGENQSFVELSYPENETWLGSTNPEIIKDLASTQKLVKEKVEQKMLDDYFDQIENRKSLIKIDTEGNELAVLRGAVKTIQTSKPNIIFESEDSHDRLQLFNFFAVHNYKIYHLPWKPTEAIQPLASHQFIASLSTNFLAIPAWH